MDNVTLKIYKWNDVNKTINIQDICSSIKMYCSHTNITTELNFTIAYEYNDYYFYKFDIGDQVCLWYKGGLIFYGRITDSEFNLKNNTYTFTCYDLAWWIIKSNITRNLDNISVKDALYTVFGDIDLKAFDIDSELGDDGNILIGTHLIKNKSAKDVLMAIMQEVSKKTDVYYYMHMNTNCKIVITECDKYYSGVTIQESSKDVIDGNLIDYTINRSMQDMVNKINIFNSDYKQINYLTLSDFDEDRYGTIQDNVILEEDEEYSVELETKIKKKLDQKGNPSEEVQVKCLGDINYKVGYGVMCKLPDSTFYDRFMYILASEWEWVASGDFISTLSLSTSKHKDLTDFSDIEEKKDDEDGENKGSLADKVVEYAKTFLGYPYLYGGIGKILTEELVKANPKIATLEGANDNWKNWIGKEAYDCSGFTQAVYKHFSIDITRTTTNNQMGQGKAINASDSSKWKEGDLMFPSANHVQMYIGNGRIIHAPESGRVIQIDDARSSYACVRRVLKDEDFIATKNNTIKSASSSNGKYSDKLVEFTKSWEGYRSYWYTGDGTYTIGYGISTAGNLGKRLKAEGITSCTEEEATKWLKDELDEWATSIQKYCTDKGAILNQSSFDCMVDLSYQWGYTILKGKNNIFDNLCSGDISSAKDGIRKLGYATRDKARCDVLDGNYTLNN